MARSLSRLGSTSSADRFSRRRPKVGRKARTYWAECGFLILAVLFLRPQIAQQIVSTVQTERAETSLAGNDGPISTNPALTGTSLQHSQLLPSSLSRVR